MNKRRWATLLLAGLLLVPLAACGKKEPGGDSSGSAGLPDSASGSDEPSASVFMPVEETQYPYSNPLTGEGLDEDISARRPYAVMFNNLRKAMPQVGVSRADVIYEIVAEGGITRMMAVFQDLEGVGDMGSIRSARDYYVSIAKGHDAIYIHAGGSPQAYDAFDDWKVTHIDFVNGPYGNMCWRDPDRRKNAGMEHSLFTSGEKVLEQLPSRFRLDHEDGFSVGWTFSKDSVPGVPVRSITVPFSKYKTGYFSYDAEKKQYLISQSLDGSDPIEYVDGQTGEPVTVSNVLVLFTDVGQVKGDDKGRREVRTTGEGKGLLFRDGVLYEITWQREKRTDCYSFQNGSGQPVSLAVGSSYINIVSSNVKVEWE